MTLKELKDLLKVLRANGVTKYLTTELQLELTDLPTAKETLSAPPVVDDYQAPSEDDLLFYSSSVPKPENQ